MRLRGVSAPGGFAPAIWYPETGNIEVTVLGKSQLPEPMRLFPTVILDPALDSFWVEVTGVATETRTENGYLIVTFNDGFDHFDLFIAGVPILKPYPRA